MVKEKKREIRIVNANKVLELIKSFGVADEEVTKILSRAYSLHKHPKPSKDRKLSEFTE